MLLNVCRRSYSRCLPAFRDASRQGGFERVRWRLRARWTWVVKGVATSFLRLFSFAWVYVSVHRRFHFGW